MDAVVWLLDRIGLKLKNKLGIICLVLLALFGVALNFMEINSVLCLFITCLVIVTERIYFDEIAKNNVIPLITICGNKRTLIRLFTQKVIYVEVPYILITAVISIGWDYFHHAEMKCIFWTFVTVGLFWAAWTQCIFFHFWLMFFNTKAATWFETGIFVMENIILQLMRLFKIAMPIALFACAAALLLVALAGRQIIGSGERRKKSE